MILTSIKLIFKLREAFIKLFSDYSSFVSDAKYKAKNGKRLKILTPK